MNTLRILTVGMVFAAATAAAATASEQQLIDTITVTAKRHATGSAADRVAPQSDVAMTFIMPTDMPEAEIDFHLSPIGAAPPAPAVERAAR
jgi:hypothetical protein